MFLLYFVFSALAYQAPSDFFHISSDVKALVFLSKDCPCSKSHVDHLNQLSAEFKHIPIYGVISDLDTAENGKEIEAYYNFKSFQFPLIRDGSQTLLQQFKALKTPHVVLLRKQPNGEYTIVYEGGLTDERDGAKAKTFFLKENLLAISKNKPLPHTHAKSLGCYIRRI